MPEVKVTVEARVFATVCRALALWLVAFWNVQRTFRICTILMNLNSRNLLMLLYYERFVVSQHNWRRKPKIHFKRYWSCRAFASPLYCTVAVSTWKGGANGHSISFCGVYNVYIYGHLYSCLLQCYGYQASHVWPFCLAWHKASWNVLLGRREVCVVFLHPRLFSIQSHRRAKHTNALDPKRKAAGSIARQGLEEEDLWRDECGCGGMMHWPTCHAVVWIWIR